MGSGRFDVVPVPYALPGACFVCGSATKKFYVDFKTSLDFHGAIYLCSDCITEIAHLCGFLSPEATEKLKAEFERMETLVFELKKKEDGLEVAIGGLVAAGLSIPDVPNGNGHSSVPDETTGKELQGAADKLGEGKGASVKPSKHENVGELRSNDGSDAAEFSLNL